VVGDDRIIDLGAAVAFDVPQPAAVVVDRVDRQADDLGVALVELGLELGELAEFRRAHWGEVLGVREQDAPAVAEPFVEMDLALRRVGGEIGRLRANA
jgi:hypothetical protein